MSWQTLVIDPMTSHGHPRRKIHFAQNGCSWSLWPFPFDESIFTTTTSISETEAHQKYCKVSANVCTQGKGGILELLLVVNG